MRHFCGNLALCLVYLAFFPVFLLAQGSQQGQNGASERAILRVSSAPLWIPAPLGTSAETLGRGFDHTLSEFDVSGKRYQVYSGKRDTTEELLYDARCTIINNDLEFRANAQFLGLGSVSVASQEQTRYAVFSVYHIVKTITLNAEGNPQKQADFFALKVHYGWAVHYIVSGASDEFTIAASAELQDIAGVGGNVSATAKKYNLKVELRSQGLQPNSAEFVFAPDKIKEKFSTLDNQPRAIFVELFPLRDVETTSIPWRTRLQSEGRYMIDSLRVELTERTSENQQWDNDGVGGNKPDVYWGMTLISGTGDAPLILGDTLQNTLTFTSSVQRTFQMSSLYTLLVGVYDDDGVDSTYSKVSLFPKKPEWVSQVKPERRFQFIGSGTITQVELLRSTENAWIYFPTLSSPNIRRMAVRLRREP
jgi:hypothetical protein